MKGNTMSNCNCEGTSGKNAYEIRLEILKMAAAQADGFWYAELDRASRASDGKNYELPEDKRVRETLKIAKKLYAFVEGDKTTEEA